MTSKPVETRHSAPRETIAFARKSFHGAKAVGSFLPGLTTRALQKYGFSTASLIMDWPAVVGTEIAACAVPERIRWPHAAEQADDEGTSTSGRRSGAVLTLRVDGAKALDIQYRGQQIIERINAYFGYAAIAQIRVIQVPIARTLNQRVPRLPALPLTREVAGVADAGLRDALARLGAEIRAGR
jgi:hypothetical protein